MDRVLLAWHGRDWREEPAEADKQVMRGTSGLGSVVDNENANTRRSKRWRERQRAQRPQRYARVLEAARSLVSSAARDDWHEATKRAREIRCIYNPAKDPPIAGVEVLLRSLVWISNVHADDNFGDAASLLEPSIPSLDFEDDRPERADLRRVDYALWLLYVAAVQRADWHTFQIYLCTLVDGMRWHLRPSQTPEGMRTGFREAPHFVRRFTKALGDGPDAERLARRVLLCLEHPGHTIIIPKQRRLEHPLSAIVLTDHAWTALHQACLGGDGRDGVSALVAPSTGGSGRSSLERARATVNEWPEVFALFAERSEQAAAYLKVTPRVARKLVREREATDDGIPF